MSSSYSSESTLFGKNKKLVKWSKWGGWGKKATNEKE